MKSYLSKDKRNFYFPKKSINTFAILTAFLICLITNFSFAQTTTVPKSVGEPVDPIREEQKKVYFKELNQGELTPVSVNQSVVVEEPVDPAREQQKADYLAGKQNNLPEALPEWKDTGDYEADDAVYREALKGWIERNGHLYEEEEIEFLFRPVLKLEEREKTLKNL